MRLTVVSKTGKEATIGILGQQNFFGEGSLAGQALRMGSAAAADRLPASADREESDDGCSARRARPVRHVCSVLCWRAIFVMKRISLTNCSIPARRDWPASFLMLAHFGKEGVPETVVPKISQETLAEMVGTTRSQ